MKLELRPTVGARLLYISNLDPRKLSTAVVERTSEDMATVWICRGSGGGSVALPICFRILETGDLIDDATGGVSRLIGFLQPIP